MKAGGASTRWLRGDDGLGMNRGPGGGVDKAARCEVIDAEEGLLLNPRNNRDALRSDCDLQPGMTSAVLFDMDGVLVRSETVWFRAVSEAGLRFRGRAITEAEFVPTFGQGTAADIPHFGLQCTVAELDAFYIEAFVRHLDAMWVNPEARPLLEALAERRMPCALVTNTVGSLATRILKAASLTDCFASLCTADRVAQAKPAPDLLLLACHELGVSPGDAVMVGDSRFDRAAALAAGVSFVGLGIDGERRIETLGALLPLVSLSF